MQFIPSTWTVVGVDADGDGRRDPQDIDDASLATAVYLCSGSRRPGDPGRPAGRRAPLQPQLGLRRPGDRHHGRLPPRRPGAVQAHRRLRASCSTLRRTRTRPVAARPGPRPPGSRPSRSSIPTSRRRRSGPTSGTHRQAERPAHEQADGDGDRDGDPGAVGEADTLGHRDAHGRCADDRRAHRPSARPPPRTERRPRPLRPTPTDSARPTHATDRRRPPPIPRTARPAGRPIRATAAPEIPQALLDAWADCLTAGVDPADLVAMTACLVEATGLRPTTRSWWPCWPTRPSPRPPRPRRSRRRVVVAGAEGLDRRTRGGGDLARFPRADRAQLTAARPSPECGLSRRASLRRDSRTKPGKTAAGLAPKRLATISDSTLR